MANSKVEDLTAASTLDGTELLYAVQGGADRKATVDQILDGLTGARVNTALGYTAADQQDVNVLTNRTLDDIFPALAPGEMLVARPLELGGSFWDRLPPGNEGDVLTMVGGVPTWVAP